MTHPSLARRGYDSSTKATGTPRSVEYKLFAQISGALSRSQKQKTEDYPGYVAALSRNLELWTVLGSDVAAKGNHLPSELKSQIFYLSEFTREHTRQILSGEQDLDADILLSINSNIMLGLRGQQEISQTPS